nr:hypothetical protein [Tanacetum cinerariifolium]
VTHGVKKVVVGPDVEKGASTNPVQSGSLRVKITVLILYFNVATTSCLNGDANKNGGEQVGSILVNEFPTSNTTKVSPTSKIIANIRILKANVPNDADYDIWLPLTSVHEVNDRMKNSLYGYARVLIEINACNNFSDNLVIAVPDREGNRYTGIDNKASMSSMQEEGQRSTSLIEKINSFEKQLLEGKCVLIGDDGKPLNNVDYSGHQGSDDELESRETYGNADVDYDTYDDDMYEGHEILENIQSICDNLDINVHGRKKKELAAQLVACLPFTTM